jgi:P2 family phage contractile tail tube protein
MGVNVNRITNANLYIDGVGLLGMAEEIKIPGIKGKFTDHKGLGMAGTAEFPAGIDKLEATIKWASIYLSAELLMNSPYESRHYQARANIETYNSMGILAQVPGVWLFTGALKDGGSLGFKQHDNVEKSTTIAVYHLEQYVAGVQTLLYDVLANIYVVNGVDQLAQFRANIGEGLGFLGAFGL